MADTALAPPGGQRWRAHASVLAFGTFVIGTDAFVIAGLLPDISDSLDVSVGAAGQLVSVFSLAYAVCSPVLAALTAAWPRRTVLVTALLVFAAGNVATALAPAYGAVLAARVVAGAGAAMFTPNAGAYAAALAGPERRGRAIAIVTVGLTSSLVLGAPLGTVIGDRLGWQATMWFVTCLALLVAPVIAWRLPSQRPDAAPGLGSRLAPMADRRILGVLACTLVAFIGVYIPYTYIASIFGPATEGAGSTAVLLLVFGIAGTAGNLTAGRLADRYGPHRVVVGAMLAMVAVCAAMPPSRGSFAAALVVVTASGVASWSVTAPQQQRIIALAPRGAESLVVALNASVLYLAVSLAGVTGAVALDVLGSGEYLSLVAAAFALAAAGLTRATGRRERRSAAARTEPAPAPSATARP